MKKQNEIKVFEDKQVRSVCDEKQEKWFISIVDVIEILTGTDRPRKYWSDLKAKLKKEGSELSEKIGQLKMCKIYNQIGSLATLKSHLHSHQIFDFKSLREVNEQKKIITK